MYNLYQIIENIVIFISHDVIYKFILPIIFIFLVFDVIRYLFSKESKKEDIIGALKGKAIGFTVLIFLPFIIMGFLSIFQKMTGIKPDVDTSILQKLTGGKTFTSTTNGPTPTTSAVNPAN